MGFTITESFCLSPILRFNKNYWFYLQSIPVWGCCNFIRLSYCMVSWLEFEYLYMYVYMYVYMYLWEKRPCCVNLWFSIFGEKWPFHKTITFIHFSIFHLKAICSRHVLHLWYRGKQCQSRNICYIMWYLKRNNFGVKTILLCV